MLSVCSSPPSHFSDIRECQRLKFFNVALVVVTRMEDGQGLKGVLSFTFVSTASLPSPSDPRLSLAFSSGLYFALNRPLVSLTRSPTFLLQLRLILYSSYISEKEIQMGFLGITFWFLSHQFFRL